MESGPAADGLRTRPDIEVGLEAIAEDVSTNELWEACNDATAFMHRLSGWRIGRPDRKRALPMAGRRRNAGAATQGPQRNGRAAGSSLTERNAVAGDGR